MLGDNWVCPGCGVDRTYGLVCNCPRPVEEKFVGTIKDDADALLRAAGSGKDSPIQDLDSFARAIYATLQETDEPGIVMVFSRGTLRKLAKEITALKATVPPSGSR